MADDTEIEAIDWDAFTSAVNPVEIQRGAAVLSHTLHQARYADLMRGIRG